MRINVKRANFNGQFYNYVGKVSVNFAEYSRLSRKAIGPNVISFDCLLVSTFAHAKFIFEKDRKSFSSCSVCGEYHLYILVNYFERILYHRIIFNYFLCYSFDFSLKKK